MKPNTKLVKLADLAVGMILDTGWSVVAVDRAASGKVLGITVFLAGIQEVCRFPREKQSDTFRIVAEGTVFGRNGFTVLTDSVAARA